MDSANQGTSTARLEKMDSGRREPRVVVVGAGIAGVGAVGVLRAGGINDVVLLEAHDRPGGRLQTVELEDGFVELGAQFLHGKSDIYYIAEQEGMLSEEEEESMLPDTLLQFSDFLFCTSNGKLINKDVVKKNIEVMEKLLDDGNEFLKQGMGNDVNVSLGDYMRFKHDATVSSMVGTSNTKQAMLKWAELWEHQDCGGAVDQLSLPGTCRYVFCPGDGTRVTTKGLEAVFQCMMRDNVPPESLRLNKAVKTIRWSNTGIPSVESIMGKKPADEMVEPITEADRTKYGVNNNLILSKSILQQETTVLNGPVNETATLERQNQKNRDEGGDSGENPRKVYPIKVDKSSAGNKVIDVNFERTKPEFNVKIECEDGEVYFADHVIVTASMGFLKENPEFFQPSLGAQHRAAVESMGFGNVSKMFLVWKAEEASTLQSCLPCLYDAAAEWRQKMLGSDVEGMIPLWLDGEQQEPDLVSDRHRQKMSNGRHWYQEVSIFHTLESHDFCIVGWVAGEAAIVMESLLDSEVKGVLHELLTLTLGKPDLPLPSQFLRSKWHSDPYVRGAYSYLATGVPLELHDILSEPLPSLKNPVVQLAGEACSKYYYSTAHGALQSGGDAARAILNCYDLEHK